MRVKKKAGRERRKKMIVVFVFIVIVSVGGVAENNYGNQEAQNAIERFRIHLEQWGLNNFRNHLEELLSEWKTHSIHIGVTGQSGVGKSTFINTIRGLQADDPQAAPVGVDETTKTIASYPDKNNTNFVYWDLPGCGTSNFPRDNYLKLIDISKFDHLIIITANRFTENDLWLVAQFEKCRKPFFLVRNKINADLENERQDHPLRSEQEVIKKILNNLMSQLNDPLVLAPIYLISTRLNHYHTWDFPKLIMDLLETCPKIKQQALVLSLVSNCKSVVEQKVQALRQRVWMIATLSAAANVVPIPGLSVACDVALLEYETKFYKKTLALDTDSLLSVISSHGITLDELKRYYETLDDKIYSELIFGRELVSYIIKRFSTYTVTTLAKEVLCYIPIIGQAVSSTTSFSMTYVVLNDLLDDLHIAAIKLLHFIELHQYVG